MFVIRHFFRYPEQPLFHKHTDQRKPRRMWIQNRGMRMLVCFQRAGCIMLVSARRMVVEEFEKR